METQWEVGMNPMELSDQGPLSSYHPWCPPCAAAFIDPWSCSRSRSLCGCGACSPGACDEFGSGLNIKWLPPQLHYNDTTPFDYQPPSFRDAVEEDLKYFDSTVSDVSIQLKTRKAA